MSIKKLFALALCLTLVPLAASAELTDRAEILSGHVVLVQPALGDVVVTLDRELDLDGAIEEAFVFRTDALVPTDLPEIDGPARLVVKPSSIWILPEVGPKIVLAIGAPGFKARRLQPDGVVILDQGFEISRVQGAFELDPESLAYELAKPRQEPGFVARDAGLSAVFEGAAGCISGGEGADSCSLGGDVEIVGVGGGVECTVSCRDGYDACCDTSGCGCQAN